MTRVARWAGWVLVAAATLYFLSFARDTIGRVDWSSFATGGVFAAIVAAAGIYVFSMPIASYAWGRLLAGSGVHVPTRRLIMIVCFSQIAKYAPGNIGQHVGRVLLALREKIPPGPLVLTLVAEVPLTIAAGVMICLASSVVSPGDHKLSLPLGPAWLGGMLLLSVAAVVAGIPFLARILPRLASRLFPTLAAHATVAHAPVPASYGIATATYVTNFIVAGMALYVVALALAPVSLSWLPLFVTAFSLAWLAGFIAPGAPAGLGVREGVLVAVLGPVLPPGLLLQVVLSFRLATLLGDLIALGLGAALRNTHAEHSCTRKS